ncbi:predicted protein [Histoplasma capsulatum H143]|uniref:Uncharacterized protein n=1 Tax=Ajellomyces capsulatus (strain H143) TaxID=544712 RepID=C6HR43_AJECH|nr:predicted protein [Histoplasma capsulatum H143]
MAIQFNLQGGGPNPEMADWPSIPAQYGVPVHPHPEGEREQLCLLLRDMCNNGNLRVQSQNLNAKIMGKLALMNTSRAHKKLRVFFGFPSRSGSLTTISAPTFPSEHSCRLFPELWVISCATDIHTCVLGV